MRAKTIEMMLELIRTDLAELGIHHDVFFSERSLIEGEVNEVEQTIEELRGKGLVYEGRLPPPKGKLPDDWEDREQTLFRATEFGDDVDRALIKVRWQLYVFRLRHGLSPRKTYVAILII